MSLTNEAGKTERSMDVVLSPAEIDLLPERGLEHATVVVFDVLRATSTMITALANGAVGIHPVRTIDEAWAAKELKPECLLGGERHGEKIEGFDLGNSPLEYGANVRGREIISTTTNGTIALRASEGAREVLAGALLNIEALAAHLRRGTGEVVLVCAGTYREAALEDTLAAGMLVALMGEGERTDAAMLALALYQQNAGALGQALRMGRNGRALLRKGREAEVEWCAQTGSHDLLGVMSPEGVVRRMQPGKGQGAKS